MRAARRLATPRSHIVDMRGSSLAASTAMLTATSAVPVPAVASTLPRRSIWWPPAEPEAPQPWHQYRKPIALTPITPHVPRAVPEYIVRPPYAQPGWRSDPRDSQHELRGIEVKGPMSILGMRTAGEQASYIRAYAGSCVAVGRSTDEIDAMVHAEVCRIGSYPSPLGYASFPKSICTSVNQVVVHGIPDGRKLEEGDIVNIDVSVYDKSGFHGDCSGMVSTANNAVACKPCSRRALFYMMRIYVSLLRDSFVDDYTYF
jgi:hypothetical protein